MKKKKTLTRKPARNRFSDWWLFLFLLFLPVQLGRHFFFDFSYLNGVRVDYLAPTLYLTDILALFLLLTNFRVAFNFIKQKAVVLVSAILLINVLFSQSPLISVYQFFKIIELLIVFAVFSKTAIANRLMLAAFTLGALAETTLTIQQFISKHSIQGIYYFLGERYFTLSTPGIAKAAINGVEFLRPYGSFSHPNSLAGFYLLIYIMVLTNKRFVGYRWLKYLLLFLCSLLIFITFSKIAILAYFLVSSFYLLSSADRSCRLCTIAKVTVMITLILIVFRVQTDPLTIQKRWELLGNAAVIIRLHPLFGVGPGTYLLSQSQFVSRFNFFFNQPVHNIFLLFLAENGLITGGAILIMVFLFFRRHWPKLLFVFLALFLTGAFDHYWLTLQQNWLLMAAVMGVSQAPFSPRR